MVWIQVIPPRAFFTEEAFAAGWTYFTVLSDGVRCDRCRVMFGNPDWAGMRRRTLRLLCCTCLRHERLVADPPRE